MHGFCIIDKTKHFDRKQDENQAGAAFVTNIPKTDTVIFRAIKCA